MPSPIEAQFLAAWKQHFPHVPLATEYVVYNGRYRIDFAHPPTKIAVELDGYEYHSDRDKFTDDRRRDRALQRDGWRVLHFSGREVYQNADACVHEVYAIIAQSSPIAQPVLVLPPQPWQFEQHDVAQTRSDRRGRKRPCSGSAGITRGCALAIFAIGVFMLVMFALFMMFGGLTFLLEI